MSRVKKILGIGSVLVVCAATGLQAQEDDEWRREGFWASVGLGAGRNFEPSAEQTGGAFYARLGGTLSERILLGGEVDPWGWSSGGLLSSRTNMTATLVYLPGSARGLFLKGGLGPATALFEIRDGSTTSTSTDTGLGGTVGIGQDVRLSESLFLTPNLDFMFQRLAGQSVWLGVVTLGLTWH